MDTLMHDQRLFERYALFRPFRAGHGRLVVDRTHPECCHFFAERLADVKNGLSDPGGQSARIRTDAGRPARCVGSRAAHSSA